MKVISAHNIFIYKLEVGGNRILKIIIQKEYLVH